MLETKAFAAFDSTSPLAPYSFQRREPGPNDVLIRIQFCGVCHSDLHQVRNDWKNATYPMVPGHEIVGTVERVGAAVTRFSKGDRAGVGCLVDSCRTCRSCEKGLEQYCEGHAVMTYNGTERDGKTVTQGGYSSQIVVDEKYALRISKDAPLDGVAPLLCAGITTYSPLRHWGVGKGHRVAIAGLGGLGHMAVKLAAALGAEVTVLSSSPSKKADGQRLGAHDFVLTSDARALVAAAGRFDFILDTVSAPHDLVQSAQLLRTDGVMILVGAPDKPASLPAFPLIMRRRSIAGSLIGGIAETQEMLDFCAARGITADVETIRIQSIDAAYDRMLKGDVRYRFVIDLGSLEAYVLSAVARPVVVRSALVALACAASALSVEPARAEVPAEKPAGEEPAPVAPPPVRKKSRVTAFVFGGLTIAGIGVGAGLFAAHSSKLTDAGALSARITTAHGTCLLGAPTYDSRCATVGSLTSSADVFRNFSVVGFVAGGVAGLALATYVEVPILGALHHVLWPEPRPAPKAAGSIRCSPCSAGGRWGITLTGTF